jgi:hypothetical protein
VLKKLTCRKRKFLTIALKIKKAQNITLIFVPKTALKTVVFETKLLTII